MKQGIRSCAISVLCLSLLLLFNGLSFCQEAGEQTQNVTENQTVEPEDSWLWGDVVSLDTAAGQLVLKYIDYESDSEKKVSVYTSAETTYENVSGLAEIKPEDTVSVDYITAADGKITAKHISVEKLESVPEEADMSNESNESEVSE